MYVIRMVRPQNLRGLTFTIAYLLIKLVVASTTKALMERWMIFRELTKYGRYLWARCNGRYERCVVEQRAGSVLKTLLKYRNENTTVK